jgi:hypothetical protein
MLARSFAIVLIALPTLAALPSATGRSNAQQSPFGDVALVASPTTYTGTCPAHLRFEGRVHVNVRPMEFDYHFERSDGAKSATKVVHATRARGEVYVVTDRWQLGAKGQHLQVWEKLIVTSGDAKVESNQAGAEVTCR